MQIANPSYLLYSAVAEYTLIARKITIFYTKVPPKTLSKLFNNYNYNNEREEKKISWNKMFNKLLEISCAPLKFH